MRAYLDIKIGEQRMTYTDFFISFNWVQENVCHCVNLYLFVIINKKKLESYSKLSLPVISEHTITTQIFYIPKTLLVCFYKAEKEFSHIQCFSGWQHDRFIPLKKINWYSFVYNCNTLYSKFIIRSVWQNLVSGNMPSRATFRSLAFLFWGFLVQSLV
jgi:hypothetical protein